MQDIGSSSPLSPLNLGPNGTDTNPSSSEALVERSRPTFPTNANDADISENYVQVISQAEATSHQRDQTDGNVMGSTRIRSDAFSIETEIIPASVSGQGGALKPGFKWQYQIVFRTKLTAHTAFERQDNQFPASITAIAIHPDHSRVYVGDSRGRVLQWLVCESAPGKAPVDNWMRDEGSSHCMACQVPFSFTERRHHCRNCGKLFCAKCSNYQTIIPQKRITTNVRVCHSCYSILTTTSPTATIA